MTQPRGGIAIETYDGVTRLRRYDIDWLRVLAVLSVLVVHAAQVYSPWQTWHVQNAERSRALAAGMLVAGLWVMPLFMMLAGRSARYARRSRGDGRYLKARIARLLPPLVIGTLIVVPPQIYVHRRLDGSFHGSFFEFYPRFFDGIYPVGNFSWAHLWFLAYLVVYAIITMPVLRRIDDLASRPAASMRSAHLLLLALASIVAQPVLRSPFPQTNAIVSDWANHALLLPTFLAGYLLSSSSDLEAAIVRRRRWFLAVAVVLSGAIVAYALPGDFGQRLPGSYSIEYAVFWTSVGTATWAWLLGITGFARMHLDRGSSMLAQVHELVYPFYVFHQTAVVLIAWKLVESDLPLSIEFPVLLGLAFLATAAASYAVRQAKIGRQLFGMAAPAPRS